MDHVPDPRWARALWQVLPAACIVLLVGCQSYEPVPLDLAKYRADAASRLAKQESLGAFAKRLAGPGSSDNTFDLSDGISSAEAEVVALFYNRDLRLARLSAGVALADAKTAGAWEDPVFGFDGADVVSASAPLEYGLTLGFTVPISGRLSVEKDRADKAYEAALRRVVDAEWTLRADVRQAWAQWSAANERLVLIDQVLKEIGAASAIADRLEAANELTRVQARLLRAERVGLRVERVSAQAQSDRAKLRLLGLMGLLPGAKIKLTPGIPAVRIPQAKDPAARLIRANTALAVARADYAVAEQTLRLEVRKQYPDLNLGLGLGREENEDRLLLGASIRIPILNANKNAIAKARARRGLARAEAQAQFERLAFKLAGTRASLAATRKQRKVLQDDLAPMLDKQSQQIARLAELGQVDVLLLLETTRRQLDAKQQILSLRLAERRAEIELAHLLGPDEAQAPAKKTTSKKNTSEPAKGATR